MCNIAGYLGNRQAAPILVEMLRRQQYYDGDMCTGIALIHDGKLTYRKIVGNVDTFVRETDVLSLPGTVGIAHTRPSRAIVPPHPQISPDGRTATVTNGTTPRSKYWPQWDEAVDLLDRNGYVLNAQENPDGKSPKLSRNGRFVGTGLARNYLLDFYLKQGDTPTRALVRTCEHMYNENVTVALTEYAPDRIFVLRTTRPMTAVTRGGETYLATTRFALPDDLGEEAFDLPLFRACFATREGITLSADRMEMEPVGEMTPYTYHEAYKRFEALLKSERAPLYFDELEAAANEMRDLWPGDHTFVQHARLVYDMLWQFDREGRLHKEAREQAWTGGKRHRWYFWLDK